MIGGFLRQVDFRIGINEKRNGGLITDCPKNDDHFILNILISQALMRRVRPEDGSIHRKRR